MFNLFRYLSVNDILAIVPDFERCVGLAEEEGTELANKAETLKREAKTKLETAKMHKKNAKRKLNAVKKFRNITK